MQFLFSLFQSPGKAEKAGKGNKIKINHNNISLVFNSEALDFHTDISAKLDLKEVFTELHETCISPLLQLTQLHHL